MILPIPKAFPASFSNLAFFHLKSQLLYFIHVKSTSFSILIWNARLQLNYFCYIFMALYIITKWRCLYMKANFLSRNFVHLHVWIYFLLQPKKYKVFGSLDIRAAHAVFYQQYQRCLCATLTASPKRGRRGSKTFVKIRNIQQHLRSTLQYIHLADCNQRF